MLPIRIITLAVPALLAGCASLPADWGRGAAAERAAVRGLSLPPHAATQALTAQWLAEPLGLDRAIQIALVNNPELRSRYAQLGFAAADVYEAGRLPNPLLSATRLSAGAEPHAQLTLGLAIDFTDALFLRRRQRAAASEFDAEQSAVAAAALDLAAEVEAAYRRSAAATQIATLRTRLAQAAAASAALAERYFDAGNLKRGSLALEQASRAETAQQAEVAALDAELARHELQRLLGVREKLGDLAEPLAVPGAPEPSLDALLTLARTSRLDIIAARTRADAIAQRYGLARSARYLDSIEIGAERERDYDGSVHAGPHLGVALPLFDSGAGRVTRAQAALDDAESVLAARELDMRRDLGSSYARVTRSRARVERYRNALIPAREEVVAQLQREHNYMLVGIFELLAARQQCDEAYVGYLEALRDYAVARAELARAVGRRLPDTAASAAPEVPQPQQEQPQQERPATRPDAPHHHGAE